MSDYDRNLFGTIERFVPLTIEATTYEVPDRLELLRVFQFLDFSIDYARLCWNGSCKRCIVSFEAETKSGEALSCRLRSSEGMNLTKLPPTIRKPVERSD
jgi:hypothetical protein